MNTCLFREKRTAATPAPYGHGAATRFSRRCYNAEPGADWHARCEHLIGKAGADSPVPFWPFTRVFLPAAFQETLPFLHGCWQLRHETWV